MEIYIKLGNYRMDFRSDFIYDGLYFLKDRERDDINNMELKSVKPQQ